ncbi:hypothetical protein GGI05_004232, partial [Coemansia sp. RSA 2603]
MKFIALSALALAAVPFCSAGCSTVNSATVDLIKSFEGFVPSPKPDPIGLPTVGYGHLCKKPKCSEVPYRFPLSSANADALLRSDIAPFT